MTAIFGLLMGSWGAGQATQLAPDAAKAKEGRNNIFRIVDRKTKIDSMSAEGSTEAIAAGSIEFENVSFAYPSRQKRVLKDVSFTLEPGM